MADNSKPTAQHLEAASPSTDIELQQPRPQLAYNDLDDDDNADERAPEARGRDASSIDASYWRSARFLGSMAAIGLGFMGGTGGYALVAPVLSDINADLGPSPNIAWVGLVYVLTEAVFFLLVGRLSDIFGRRWFFITGSLIGLVGTIIGATAQSVNTLIGAEVLIGLAAAFQISFFWVIAELVPVKWRYLANSYAYIVSIPTNPLAAKIAFTMQRSPLKWRGSFIFMAGVNALSALCCQTAVTALSTLRNEADIGLAGGLAGTIRSFVSAIAVAIYSTVLKNRLNTTIPQYVAPAAEQAGLPPSSLPALILGLGGTGPLTATAVPGLTSAIEAAATTAYRYANAQAYRTIFFTSFAFGGAGMILVWFVADKDKTKENFVGGHVHDPRQEKALEGEKG
ncbi:hypothetical protein B0A54_09570 [Friedmanniomyces endolithicus]|uniref:Major facilitator superfamily (MFS) profile domain-containing protein n=1 Tax=Friedmanniomyces endolithicus TaxID=329885 RepID=A0A4U0URT1_9PEZI|nr:hypothetical protein B0A54_09570 [Friedmanniomyces endolithicus]